MAVQPRIHVKDQADLPGAQKVLAAITVQGLAQYQGKPAPKPLTYKYETPRLEPKVGGQPVAVCGPEAALVHLRRDDERKPAAEESARNALAEFQVSRHRAREAVGS